MASCKWGDSDMIKILSVFVLVAVLAAGSFAVNDAFATHFSEDTKWQLVYLTDTPVCSNYDYQIKVLWELVGCIILEGIHAKWFILCIVKLV